MQTKSSNISHAMSNPHCFLVYFDPKKVCAFRVKIDTFSVFSVTATIYRNSNFLPMKLTKPPFKSGIL